MTNQTAIFIVGERDSGKSTLMRCLTGAGSNKIFKLKNIHGKLVRTFVFLNSIQEIGMTKYPPKDFLESIEGKCKVKRPDYDVLICPLRLAIRDPKYGYEAMSRVFKKEDLR